MFIFFTLTLSIQMLVHGFISDQTSLRLAAALPAVVSHLTPDISPLISDYVDSVLINCPR